MSRLFGVGLFVINSILDMFWALCRVLYLCSVYINKKTSDNHWLSEVFLLRDPPGGGTLYFLSLIISYLSCCLSFSPPISPRLNFFVLHWYTTLCQYCKDTDFCFENQRKFQEMFNGMLLVCFSQEVLQYQIPDIEFYLQSDNRIRFHYFYILVKCVLIL